MQLAFQEPEILVFGALKVAVIMLAYYIWIQFFFAVNDKNYKDTLLNIACLVWSLTVVAAASAPIALLNGAIASARILRSQRQSCTFLRCLEMALPPIISLWLLNFVDSWITVTQILERLPKEDERNSSLVSEFSYYLWKVGSAGMVPAMLAGQPFSVAAESSIQLLKERTETILSLRAGYSIASWIVGITTYVITALWLAVFSDWLGDARWLWRSLLLAGFPLAVAIAFVAIALHPLYLIAVTELYGEFAGIPRSQPRPSHRVLPTASAGSPIHAIRFPSPSSSFGSILTGLGIAGFLVFVVVLFFLFSPL